MAPTLSLSVPLLPDGLVVPPLGHLLVLLVAAAAVAFGLRRRPPAVTERSVLALAPWMAVGSCLHVLYVIDALPPVLAPFGAAPAVYLTVAIVAGAVWVAADELEPETPVILATTGSIALLAVATTAFLAGGDHGYRLFWPTVALAASIPVTAIVWTGLVRAFPAARVPGGVGALVVFGHALDGISTAVGVTQMGFGERTPLSRWLLEFGGSLPSVPVLGTGWLFVVVKLLIACAVVWLFVPYVRDEPTEGYLLLGFIAAVGLGPGAHNLLLFAVG